jgi:phosphate transport system substrate-binding protein
MPSSGSASGKPSIAIARRGPLALAAALLAALAACSSPGPRIKTAPPGGILLKGAGATLPAPLYQRWFDAYQQLNPKIAVAYDAVGSGEGIRRFVGQNLEPGEQIDFGASDAALTDEQIAKVRQGALLLPVTATGVVLAYNLPELRGRLRLSRQAYAGIFLGEIKSWDDPRISAANPGLKLPRLSLVTAVRQDSSGTTFAFTNHLSAINPAWHDTYGTATLINWPGPSMRGKGNERVAALVQTAVGSVGYVGLEFARKLGLKTALLENKEGHFVAATNESVTAALASSTPLDNLRLFVPDPSGADSYPIVTFSWILLYRNPADPAKAQALRDLFAWGLRDGQSYARQLGYVPLPGAVSEKALAALNALAPAR